jgi:sigma-B regulation protein RsbU (phosphoserine phosphatase)
MRDIVDRQNSVVYYEPVPTTNWSVGVVFPKFELFKQLYATTLKLGVVGLIGFMLILFFTILILRRQTRPLRQLSMAANEIGQGRFDVPMPTIHSKDEVGVLRDSLQNMQDELKLYVKNLVKTTKEKERFEGELNVAQKIQMSYLRRDFEVFAQNRDFDLSALLKPAREVGGDFFDFFNVNDSKICIAIGDVAGKGVPAALFMTIALTLTRSGDYAQTSLANVVAKINGELCRRNEDAYFVTAFYGVLDLANGEFTFCNAGHNYPYLMKSGELFEVHGTHGPALGIMADVKYKTGKLKFESGDSIVLYTDGITDAENKNAQFFDKSRLEDVLRLNLSKAPVDITRKLYQEIRKFTDGEPQSDDLTIMAMKFGSEPDASKIEETIK